MVDIAPNTTIYSVKRDTNANRDRHWFRFFVVENSTLHNITSDIAEHGIGDYSQPGKGLLVCGLDDSQDALAVLQFSKKLFGDGYTLQCSRLT